MKKKFFYSQNKNKIMTTPEEHPFFQNLLSDDTAMTYAVMRDYAKEIRLPSMESSAGGLIVPKFKPIESKPPVYRSRYAVEPVDDDEELPEAMDGMSSMYPWVSSLDKQIPPVESFCPFREWGMRKETMDAPNPTYGELNRKLRRMTKEELLTSLGKLKDLEKKTKIGFLDNLTLTMGGVQTTGLSELPKKATESDNVRTARLAVIRHVLTSRDQDAALDTLVHASESVIHDKLVVKITETIDDETHTDTETKPKKKTSATKDGITTTVSEDSINISVGDTDTETPKTEECTCDEDDEDCECGETKLEEVPEEDNKILGMPRVLFIVLVVLLVILLVAGIAYWMKKKNTNQK